MTNIMDRLEPKEWLELNAKLQKKKSVMRKELASRGILKREGNNTYDKYKYFSEAQYKELFTELFPKCGLELNFTELEYGTFAVEGKQPNGRMPKLEFYLYDTETGFFETTVITGEGIDKGDKAGYKAYTGALKYYLADKFMVATGDDPETESPEGRGTASRQSAPAQPPIIGKREADQIIQFAADVGISLQAICERYKVGKVQDLNAQQWAEAMRSLDATQKKGKTA